MTPQAEWREPVGISRRNHIKKRVWQMKKLHREGGTCREKTRRVSAVRKRARKGHMEANPALYLTDVPVRAWPSWDTVGWGRKGFI